MRALRGQDTHSHPAPHSQDGLLNRQRCVQPAVHVAAMGLVQPEDQRATLGTSLSLRREVGGGRWAAGGARAHPAQVRPRPTLPLACLTVSSTTAGEDTEKALQAAAGAGPGAGSANSGKLRL